MATCHLKRQKIILVNPLNFTDYPQPPMGLALLAAILEKEGYQVVVIDANALNLSPEEIQTYLSGADVVGLTAMTPTINNAINIAKYIREANPSLPIIIGGPHATLLPEETLNEAPQIDIVVRGEADKILLELLQALQCRQPLDSISGISYKRNSIVVSNPTPTAPINLDSLPFLAYHLFPLHKYKPHPPHGRSLPFAALITSRGCPYNCSYCSKPVFGYKFRAQSPERVIEEIVYYQKRFGVREIAFYDDVFTLNKKRAYAIAEGILKKNLKIHWTCETRVDLINKELLQHMKKSGCYSIAYGIESGSQDLLSTINKNITIEQIENAIHLTREVGLQTVGYFMLGSPGERVETIKKTIQLAKKLKLDYAQFAITTPFPGTELYRFFINKGEQEIPWDKYVYGGTGKGVFPVFESDLLSRGDLQAWRKIAYKQFYLRPAYIWQRIRELTSIRDLKITIRGLWLLFGNLRGKY